MNLSHKPVYLLVLAVFAFSQFMIVTAQGGMNIADQENENTIDYAVFRDNLKADLSQSY